MWSLSYSYMPAKYKGCCKVNDSDCPLSLHANPDGVNATMHFITWEILCLRKKTKQYYLYGLAADSRIHCCHGRNCAMNCAMSPPPSLVFPSLECYSLLHNPGRETCFQWNAVKRA
ncbi:hypothetical protein GOODEAATRI_029515 [Goodea atripinnis]|uniref:Uncharacterized protein n=1 Tax=Goodea atripinnis TaxID=208336 RepID=A0ABV0MN10_9TELE